MLKAGCVKVKTQRGMMRVMVRSIPLLTESLEIACLSAKRNYNGKD